MSINKIIHYQNILMLVHKIVKYNSSDLLINSGISVPANSLLPRCFFLIQDKMVGFLSTVEEKFVS